MKTTIKDLFPFIQKEFIIWDFVECPDCKPYIQIWQLFDVLPDYIVYSESFDLRKIGFKNTKFMVIPQVRKVRNGFEVIFEISKRGKLNNFTDYISDCFECAKFIIDYFTANKTKLNSELDATQSAAGEVLKAAQNFANELYNAQANQHLVDAKKLETELTELIKNREEKF